MWIKTSSALLTLCLASSAFAETIESCPTAQAVVRQGALYSAPAQAPDREWMAMLSEGQPTDVQAFVRSEFRQDDEQPEFVGSLNHCAYALQDGTSINLTFRRIGEAAGKSWPPLVRLHNTEHWEKDEGGWATYYLCNAQAAGACAFSEVP